jgi:hypothetical protein
MGTYTLAIVQVTESGEDKTFDGVIIQVGCTITSVPTPSEPTPFTFTLYDSTLEIDLRAIAYVQ